MGTSIFIGHVSAHVIPWPKHFRYSETIVGQNKGLVGQNNGQPVYIYSIHIYVKKRNYLLILWVIVPGNEFNAEIFLLQRKGNLSSRQQNLF